MICRDLASIILRLAQLVFAAIVAGITGAYLHSVHSESDWTKGRFIYTEVVSALSIVLALVWLLPFSGNFIHWPIDIVMFILWMVAFGLLVNFIGPLNCGSIWYWGDIRVTGETTCSQWKADVAFCFLSSIIWLASAVLGIYYVRKHYTTESTRRRRWYHSRV